MRRRGKIRRLVLQKFSRKMPGFDDIRIGDADGAFNGVEQLPHISRPWVLLEKCVGFFADSKVSSVIALGKELIGENAYISGSFRQTGNVQHGNGQSVVQILPEGVFHNSLAQVFVGSGNNPDIDLLGIVTADPDDFPIFDDTQHRGLDIQGHIADFIQKNSALICQFKFAWGTVFVSAGKGAPFISEEFTCHQFPGKGSAVYRNKGTGGIGAAAVNSVGKKLFSRSVGSQNQNIQRSRSDASRFFLRQ